VVQRLAAEHGIDLATVTGTGTAAASASKTSSQQSPIAPVVARKQYVPPPPVPLSACAARSATT